MTTPIRRKRRAAGFVALVAGVAFSAVALTGSASADHPAPNDHQIRICHATESETNPYTMPSPAKWQITAPNGHDWHDGDIIPPFDAGEHGGQSWEAYPGKNWDAEGQEIWADHCNGAEDEPEECPEGTVGEWPDCEQPPEVCPPGTTGTPPNCVTPGGGFTLTPDPEPQRDPIPFDEEQVLEPEVLPVVVTPPPAEPEEEALVEEPAAAPAPIEVMGVTQTRSELPRTGASVEIVLVGIGMLILGAGLVLGTSPTALPIKD